MNRPNLVADVADAQTLRPVALVWIDSHEAIVVRWEAGAPHVERIESDVPAHHSATGHVRHQPACRHGGGGPPQTAGEPHRLEHLARFFDIVAEHVPPTHDLLLLGPGTVHEELGRRLSETDLRQRAVREVRCEAAARMSRRQLVARVRMAAGDAPTRRTVGAYRWSGGPARKRSGQPTRTPRRVAVKRPSSIDAGMEA